MNIQALEFEKPILELEEKLKELKQLSDVHDLKYIEEAKRLKKKLNTLKKNVYSNLTPWQKTLLARHPNRPYTLDYLKLITSNFIELHGDRKFGDDHSIIGGIAQFENESVVVIGHQKGRNTKENIFRNFGMPRPEGYRKALRLMKLAEKFGRAVITFIDTPGAFPGLHAEERGQGEAIARNLFEMSDLTVPIIVIVIGEGGSGGALAIGVGDKVLMLENSVYSVISPESCSAILWKDQNHKEEAAKTLKLTAQNLLDLGLIDEIVKEPIGGAHRKFKQTASIVRHAIRRNLKELKDIPIEKLLQERYNKFRNLGKFTENSQ